MDPHDTAFTILSFVLQVDEVSFKKPVDIGDLLRLKSRVLHTRALTDNKASGQ